MEGDVIARCKAEIASFKVPRRVLFFTDADYAITGSEKVKSSVVRELAAKRLNELMQSWETASQGRGDITPR